MKLEVVSIEGNDGVTVEFRWDLVGIAGNCW